MNDQSRRYVFIDFDSLKNIKFKKLEKICDRIFVFINASEQFIPFHLVQEMQKLGNGVKWISVENPIDNDMSFHISFLMGKLHQKVSSDIEFAILSNDESFDPLVDFINNTNRSCIRVKNQEEVAKEELEEDFEEEDDDFFEEEDFELTPSQQTASFDLPVQNATATRSQTATDIELDENVIEKTAEETIRRLIRSGNRPAEVSMLKSYILLHNQELGVHGNIDKILHYMEATKDIRMDAEEVIYNF